MNPQPKILLIEDDPGIAAGLKKELQSEGYQVAIVGKHGHPEVIGIIGHTDGKAVIVQFGRPGVVGPLIEHPEQDANGVLGLRCVDRLADFAVAVEGGVERQQGADAAE